MDHAFASELGRLSPNEVQESHLPGWGCSATLAAKLAGRSRRAEGFRGEEVLDRRELPDALGCPGRALILELILVHRRGPWRTFEAVEFATLEWVDWFNNRRLLEPIGFIPPAEARGALLRHAQRPSQPRRPGADRLTVRALDRSLIHSRRSRRRPPSAGPRRRSLQSRLKAKYAHLIKTGKPAKVALTAIMRKLVVLANALLKANRTWTPKTP